MSRSTLDEAETLSVARAELRARRDEAFAPDGAVARLAEAGAQLRAIADAVTPESGRERNDPNMAVRLDDMFGDASDVLGAIDRWDAELAAVCKLLEGD